jgi:hypothetical protein
MSAARDPCRAQDWVTALRWMQWMLRQRPDDPRLLSQVAAGLSIANLLAATVCTCLVVSGHTVVSQVQPSMGHCCCGGMTA